MTAKQKENRARFKKVVAEAKKLRKKNPKLTQAQAVKQAWAISYSKKKVGAAPKKKSLKKKSAKKSSSYHKDTKSHNVNIRVMSGINYEKYSAQKISLLSKIMNDIRNNEELRDRLKIGIKYKKYDWWFNDKNEMMDYIKNLFYLDITDDELMEHMYSILNSCMNQYNYYFEWELIYFVCILHD